MVLPVEHHTSSLGLPFITNGLKKMFFLFFVFAFLLLLCCVFFPLSSTYKLPLQLLVVSYLFPKLYEFTFPSIFTLRYSLSALPTWTRLLFPSYFDLSQLLSTFYFSCYWVSAQALSENCHLHILETCQTLCFLIFFFSFFPNRHLGSLFIWLPLNHSLLQENQRQDTDLLIPKQMQWPLIHDVFVQPYSLKMRAAKYKGTSVIYPFTDFYFSFSQ